MAMFEWEIYLWNRLTSANFCLVKDTDDGAKHFIFEKSVIYSEWPSSIFQTLINFKAICEIRNDVPYEMI